MKMLLSIFLLFSAVAVAGQEDVGGFAHAGIGVSLPMGDFASTHLSNPAAGYARTGLTIHALFGHKIYRQFGISGMLVFDANPLDKKALEGNLNAFNNSYRWKADGAFWTLTGFTFGPHFSQNFKKAAFDLRLGIGAMNFFSPAFTLKGTPLDAGSGNATYTKSEKRSSAWMLGGGMTYKYEIKWGWVLFLSADYYRANAEFTDVETTLEIEGQPDKFVDMVNFSQSFSMLRLTTGLGIVF